MGGAAAGLRAWGRFARSLIATAAVATTLLLVLAFLLDPYDTGRSPLPLREGVRPQGPRTAAASRGRDPSFPAAIFGNSHVQLLSPDELKARTGIPFVSLIAPATGARETFTIIDWYLRHRVEPAKALVIGIDTYWCTADPTFPNNKPFPYWLYSRSLPDYVVGLLRFDVLEEFERRVQFLLSAKVTRARPDGYWDYEDGYSVQGYDADPEKRAKLDTPMELGGGNASGPFPAAERLEAVMKQHPGTALLLLRPPVYASSHPKPGTADAAAEAACTKAYADLAARRPRTVLIDWHKDRPELHDARNFFDHTHYRKPVARLIEADIAAALSTLR